MMNLKKSSQTKLVELGTGYIDEEMKGGIKDNSSNFVSNG